MFYSLLFDTFAKRLFCSDHPVSGHCRPTPSLKTRKRTSFRAGAQQVDHVQMMSDVVQDLELSHQSFVFTGCSALWWTKSGSVRCTPGQRGKWKIYLWASSPPPFCSSGCCLSQRLSPVPLYQRLLGREVFLAFRKHNEGLKWQTPQTNSSRFSPIERCC